MASSYANSWMMNVPQLKSLLFFNYLKKQTVPIVL